MSPFKSYTLCAAIICLISACSAQPDDTPQKCSLDLSRAPTLRGLRLGMSVEELKARSPHLEVKTSSNGEGLSFADVYYGSQASDEFDFDGLHALHFGLVDGRLSNIEFSYLNQPAYAQRPHEFIDKVAGQLGLDARWCEASTARTCVISCEGFEVSITTPETYISGAGISTSTPKVSFRDVTAEQEAEVRRRSIEEEERQQFRP